LMLCPSVYPNSRNRFRSAAMLRAAVAIESGDMTPTNGIVGCCARATTGHAAALPISAMNSRRFTAPVPPVLPTERIVTSATAVDLLRCGISIWPTSAGGQSRPMTSRSHDRACPLRLSKRTICTPSQQVRFVPNPDLSRCSKPKPCDAHRTTPQHEERVIDIVSRFQETQAGMFVVSLASPNQ